MRRLLILPILFALALAQGGGYFSLGYQSAGGIEFGGGGFGEAGRLLFGGEGHGSPAGYGYGLGFVAYALLPVEVPPSLRGRLYARLAAGGGGGARWAGFLAEGGLWLRFSYEGFPAALYLAYQYAEGHAGVLLRVDLGGPVDFTTQSTLP